MTRRTKCAVVSGVVLVAVAAGAADAVAQVLQPPPRSLAGLFGGRRSGDPDRTGHQVSLTFSFLGGYEDNLSPQGSVPTDPLAPRQSGTNAIVSSQLRYRYGNTTRFFEANARGFVNSFRNLDIRAMYGGEAGARASTRLGDKAGVFASASAEYTPSFMITAAGPGTVVPIASDVVPPTDPTAGISELRSTSGNAVSTFTYDWSPRQHTEAGYAYSRHQVRSTVGLMTVGSVTTLRQTWDLSRAFALLGSYQFSNQSTVEASGSSRPVDSHTGQLGVRVTKNVSRTRRLMFNAGGGAMRVETLAAIDNSPFDYVAPSMFGGARLDLGRTWAVSADLRREVTVLEGLSDQSFLTDVAALWLGGNVGRAWSVAVNASYSNGRPHEGDIGSFAGSSAVVQLQYAVSNWASLVTSYGYYEHRLRDLSNVPAGFPSRFTRNTVSAGVSLWLPLFGAFPGERRGASGGQD